MDPEETLPQPVQQSNEDDQKIGNLIPPFTDTVAVPQPFLKKWGSLIILSLALAIIVIDTTLLNVSLSSIIRDLHTNIQSLQWVITIYALMLAALTITGGRLGDLFGRKKMFVAGAAIFAIGSFIASVSQNVGMLISGEAVIEGIGAAMMLPATASLLVANFRGRDRAIAFGVWGSIAGAASAIGPILGGWLTNEFSWRWGFRINVVIAAILIIGSFIIKESRDRDEKPTIDFVGILLSAAGLLAVSWGVIESATYGWFVAKQDVVIGNWSFNIFGASITPIAIILGLMVLDLFIEWELHMEKTGKTPLVAPEIFRNRAFTAGTVTTAVLSLSQLGIIFAIPIYLQTVLHLDALHTGFALLPSAIALFIAAPLSGAISHKISPRLLIQLGLLLNFASIFVIREGFAVGVSAWSLTPGLALFGAGMGMVLSQISNMTLSAVAIDQAGEASGVNNTMRQVGSTLGSSIIGAILLSSIVTNFTSGVTNSKTIPPVYKTQMLQFVSQQSTNIEFGGSSNLPAYIPPALGQEIKTITAQATVDAIRSAFLFASLFTALGFLVSFSLPRDIPKVGQDLAHGGH